MAGYIIVDLEVTDPQAFAEYRAMVPPTLVAYGGTYLVRGGETQTLEGGWEPKRVVVLQFDSVERAKQWWSSDDYAPAKALRQRASITRMVVAEGV